MTSRPLENEVGPRRLSADERAEGDFVSGIASGHGHRAIAISDIAGRQFYGFCPQCGWRGAQWWTKAVAQGQAERHNDQHEGSA